MIVFRLNVVGMTTHFQSGAASEFPEDNFEVRSSLESQMHSLRKVSPEMVRQTKCGKQNPEAHDSARAEIASQECDNPD